MEIAYYEMSYDDIPEVAELELKYFSQPWSESSIGHYMDQGNTIFLVARDCSRKADGTEHGTVVAYMALMCILNESDLVSIAVHEDYRNMGLARELLDIAYGMARDIGVDMIHLEVRKSNEAAISLYESEGFVRDGLRKGFYDKPKEDALLYTKQLR